MVHDLREDERELASAILDGSKRCTDQAFATTTAAATAPALGAAYEGIYRLPDTADGVRPQRLDRLFECPRRRGAHLSRMQQEEAAAGRADRAFDRRASLDHFR